MKRRILVINAHPDRGKQHLCTAFAAAYCDGAAVAGHEVRRIDLAGFAFPMLQSQDAFESGPVPEELDIAVKDSVWAQHLVFIFPLWLGTMPALMKAFLEQVMRPGIAFDYARPGSPAKTLLKGRSARIIVTMGMPALLYRLWFLSHGVATFRRGILHFVGIRPVRERFFGMIDNASEHTRRKWIEQVRRFGSKAS